MKSKLHIILLLIAFVSTSAIAQISIDAPAPSGPPDKQKLSYAMGMKLGLQHKESRSDMNLEPFIQALKDVLGGKPTLVKESELAQLFYDARRSKADSSVPAPDKDKMAYALGMRMARQIKLTGMDLDPNVIGKAIHDAAEGKPTQLKESEITPLFNQAKAWDLASKSAKNKSDGKAFLAKNAKEKGVTVLPDGLQYKVLETGTGDIPKTNDIVVLTYVGKTVDGREVDRRYQIPVRVIAPIKGIQEALQMMKVGSKWQLCIPADLAYRNEGNPMADIGPDMTLVYDLELLEITSMDKLKATGGSGRIGHGLGLEPAPVTDTKTSQASQSASASDKTTAAK